MTHQLKKCLNYAFDANLSDFLWIKCMNKIFVNIFKPFGEKIKASHRF